MTLSFQIAPNALLSKPTLLLRPASLRQTRRLTKWKAAAEDEVKPIEIVPPPEGVTMPPRYPNIPPGKFGFVDFAERWNSRAAMIGFFGILIVELIANQGILQLAGFDVGSGLGFEF